MAVKPIPEGHNTVSPYLIVRGAGDLVEFLKRVFNASLVFMFKKPDGTIGHAEVKIGDSIVMISEARDQWQPMPTLVHVYLADADAAYERAIAAGAESVMPMTDHFYGDRSGGVKDKFGNMWWMSTHIEDVSEEEMYKRMAAMGK